MRYCVCLSVLALYLALGSGVSANAASAPAPTLATAEQDYWQAVVERDHLGMLTAYLLHFSEGQFTADARRIFLEATGQAWSAETAAQAAWRDPVPGGLSGPGDAEVAGQWAHSASCDINAWFTDVSINSTQVFQLRAAGLLTGEGRFNHEGRLGGMGHFLEIRHMRGLVTYVMRAENDVSGAEVHIGVLNLSREEGRLISRGWEINTAGTYCDMSGVKLR